MDIYNWIIVGLWLCFLCYWFISAMSAKKNITRNQWQRGVWLRLLIFAGIFVLLSFQSVRQFFEYSNTLFSNPLVSTIGVVLCAAGVALAIWARRHLGRNWGMPMSLKEKPELVTSGPYRSLRHPIYTGMLLAMIGTALVVGLSWLIIFIAAGIYFVYSAKTEERIMMREFPHIYPEYKKHTKMLIPFIW